MVNTVAIDRGFSSRWGREGRSPSTPVVFCDFDGPIVDVSDRYYHTYRMALSALQVTTSQAGNTLLLHPLEKQQFWQMKQNRVPDLDIALRSGVPEARFEEFLAQVTQLVNQPALLHRDRLQPGVRWALALLHSQGIRLFLVTLRCQNQAIDILRRHGLEEKFVAIRGMRDRTAAYKNQSEHKIQLLAEVMQEHAIAPSESAWMIGDTEADVLAGQANRIRTIALTSGIRSHKYLTQFCPTRIHNDLLSAAHYVVFQAETAPAMVG